MMERALIFILLNIVTLSSGAKIFGYIPTASYSHQVVFQPLWRELSLRGHQVTLLTTDPINNPKLTNLSEIDLHFSYNIMRKHLLDIINAQGNLFKSMKLFIDSFDDTINGQLQNPEVKKLITDSNTKFDVCLIEYIMLAPFAFSKKFECPVIGLMSTTPIEKVFEVMGVPTHSTLYPDTLMPFVKANTLRERVISFIYGAFMDLVAWCYMKSVNQDTIDKHFGKDFTTVDMAVSNVSMLFVNRNPVVDRPRPMVPAVIEIGGINKKPLKPLPKMLLTELDSASKGFIYFSLGSNVKSKDISSETMQMLLETFNELPYKVLWKFELDHLPNKPDNVIISKWFPQTDVLRHPNIKLFITQGGSQSLEEAIYAKVPLIGMPFFADQHANVEKMVYNGFGLSLDFASLEKELFKKTIMEVTTNPKYKDKVKKISELVEDHPMTSLEKAVWWVEYVIRHKGAAHLRSPLSDIPWYQYLLLDVVACLILIITIPLYLIYSFIRFLIRRIKKLFVVKEKKKLQ